ncbi:MAG: T9SS type A sorting domain-containing protein, partial [Candidatus Cloacimonetes bacterium]|nr:T9SS type A sorting domain-containing protein [Candidatus Cloacimonadota bacterium]
SPVSTTFWNNKVAAMQEFCIRRPGYQREHLREFFALDEDCRIDLTVNQAQQGYIRINSLSLLPENTGTSINWMGTYFRGIPIQIEAIPNPGYMFSHWEGLEPDTLSLVTFVPEQLSYSITAHFVPLSASQILYFWLFDNDLPNDYPLQSITASFDPQTQATINFHSALEGYPFDPQHPNWRKASMERRNAPTQINYHPEANDGIEYEDSQMRGLQIKQPFAGDGGENTLTIHLPVGSYEHLFFRFAAKDEDAAQYLIIDYSLCSDEPLWQSDGLQSTIYPLQAAYQLYEVDFSGVAGISNNPDFIIRIRFGANDMYADEGKRVTFNNFSISAVPEGSPNPDDPIPGLASQYELFNAYPNPFNPQTTIAYRLDTPGEVWIEIFNLKGQQIRSYRNTHPIMGTYQLLWDGKDSLGADVSSGIYLYQMRISKFSSTKKMILLK